MKPITTFEYGIVYFNNTKQKTDDKTIPHKYFSRLEKLNQKNDAKYYTIYSDRIKFKQYVGLLQVGNLSIEVLPKIDKDEEKKKADTKTEEKIKTDTEKKWRDILIDMLRICKYIKIDSIGYAEQKLQNSSLFEIFIRQFLQEVKILMREGLHKKYRKTEDNINFYRGKLLVNNQIKYNHLHKEKFYCEFNTFDYDNKMNQILYCALDILSKMNLGSSLQDELKSIMIDLPEISLKKIVKSDFTNLVFDRAGEKYKEAIQLAKLIILYYLPDNSGHENTLAIFFDMNKLFEEYVFQILRRYHSELSPQFQKRKDLFEADGNVRHIHSDILLRMDKKNIIIDTKWKLLKNDSIKDIASADLMQMYTYSKFFNCERAILLYPDNKNTDISLNGKFMDEKNEDKRVICDIAKVVVGNEKRLKSKLIAETIRDKIINK